MLIHIWKERLYICKNLLYILPSRLVKKTANSIIQSEMRFLFLGWLLRHCHIARSRHTESSSTHMLQSAFKNLLVRLKDTDMLRIHF